MNLKEKIHFILKKYNIDTPSKYATQMLYAIEQREQGNLNYIIHEQVGSVTKFGIDGRMLVWDFNYLLGECVLQHNPDFFTN
jgi:hypothetical protein